MANELVPQLESLFNQQIDAAALLIEILQRENDALKGRHFEDIQTLTEEKAQQGLILESLCVKQSKVLENAGFSYTKEGLDTFFSTLLEDQSAVLKQLQTQLHERLEESKRLNLINGNIIAANKQSAETALAILRGNINTDNKLIYGASGQPIKETPDKPITRA